MRKFSAILLGLALAFLVASEAKALITVNITGTCLAESNWCAAGVDTISGTITYDLAGGTVPSFNVTTSADNILYDAATGGPVIFDGTSSSPPVGFPPESFMITFAGAGLPDSAAPGTIFTIDHVDEIYGGPDLTIRNYYNAIATVVPLPAALPLFLSGLAAFACMARRRRSASQVGDGFPATALILR